MEMHPNSGSSDIPRQTTRPQRWHWLAGVVVALAALIVLLVVGTGVSAQSGPEGILADPWATNFCLSGMQCLMGDFNGDGRDDIIQFNHQVNPAGAVYVRLSNGSNFLPPELWHPYFCVGNLEICKVADVNGDGRDDVVTFARGSSGSVWVALSYGSGFGAATIWQSFFCAGDEICDVGDYNGDGKADISTFLRSLYSDKQGWVYVAKSDGTKFGSAQQWVSFFCIQQEMCGSGDFNGDGKDDIIAFRKIDGPVYVATSDGSKFNKYSSPWRDFFCPGQEVCGVGDFNGDGKDDIITYLRSSYAAYPEPKIGWVYVALSNGSSFPSSSVWNTFFCVGSELCGSGNYIDTVPLTSYSQVSRTGDFNGDSRSDVVTFLRNTDLTYKPGWVYVKLAYGNQFVDSLPALPARARLPVILR